MLPPKNPSPCGGRRRLHSGRPPKVAFSLGNGPFQSLFRLKQRQWCHELVNRRSWYRQCSRQSFHQKIQALGARRRLHSARRPVAPKRRVFARKWSVSKSVSIETKAMVPRTYESTLLVPARLPPKFPPKNPSPWCPTSPPFGSPPKRRVFAWKWSVSKSVSISIETKKAMVPRTYIDTPGTGNAPAKVSAKKSKPLGVCSTFNNQG